MAINPEIMAVQRENHSRGADLVPHNFHWRQKLPDPAAESRAFFNAVFAKNAQARARGLGNIDDEGATPKRHVRIGGTRDAKGRVLPSRTFMLKPYYEDLEEWTGAYGGYPLPGWAELAIQAMMHAGGLGHMAMKVHSHLPSSGSPVLAVEIEPGMHRVGNVYAQKGKYDVDKWFGEKEGWGRVKVSDRIRGEAAKLAAFDFLTNNQDRHGGNLLFRPKYDNGEAEVDGLLAIDNGRSMHYSDPNRFHSKWGDGGRDNLFNYMHSPGYDIFQLRKPANNRVALEAIADWWKQHGSNVRVEFHKQLRGIKVREFSRHIENNFNKRADALDKFVKTLKKKGHTAYSNTRADKKAFGEISVPVGGHTPKMGWSATGEDNESAFEQDGDVCPTCGECLSCNPHTPGKNAISI